ncbi:MAG: phage scaffolding protein [Ruminococcus sp.]|nr:phage scaffolding protein [Ruminococcus sp.]
MALTKAQVKEILSGAGVSAENMDAAVDRIMDGHLTSINALREERDSFKTDAENLPKVQKELDDLKASNEKGGKDPWKVKYDALKEEFTEYKAEQGKKETAAKKSAAYRELLKECGVREKRIDAVLKVTDLDVVEFDEDGKIKDAAKLKKAIAEEWEDFIDKTAQQGANTATPPSGKSSGTVMTRADVYKTDEHGRFVLDATARQNALKQIIENEAKGV